MFIIENLIEWSFDENLLLKDNVSYNNQLVLDEIAIKLNVVYIYIQEIRN